VAQHQARRHNMADLSAKDGSQETMVNLLGKSHRRRPPPPLREGSSVADPDPRVFGPPGSGSISQRYGSGSGSFYHYAKIVRKT
jgi:hypothetical protein